MAEQTLFKTLMKKMLLLNIAASLMLAFPATAGWEEGMAAAKKGDHALAYKELLPLAEQGNISAQTTLGVMYFNGQGVPQDYDAALVWLSLAANQGHDVAQFNLGVMYDSGIGIDQDFSLAARWYQLAANQRHATAQYNLAQMYQSGDGVKQDSIRAHMWFNIAATLGNDEAAASLKLIEKTMTAKQVSSAQRLAGACVDNAYQGC